MVTKENTILPAPTRYRLATTLIWAGVLTWVPFLLLRSLGQKPPLFWFLPIHLVGVVGGARLKASANREMGTALPKKTPLRTFGRLLVLTGILVWVVYFYLKLVAHAPVEVSQFLPYHLTAMLNGVAVLLLDFLIDRRKSSPPLFRSTNDQ